MYILSYRCFIHKIVANLPIKIPRIFRLFFRNQKSHHKIKITHGLSC